MPDRGHRLVPSGLCVILFAALATSVVMSQSRESKTPTFRTGIEQIEVSVIARDGSGKFVSDLTMEDFEVFEDGKRQQLNNVALIDLPMVSAPPSAKVLPLDVATNAQRTDGRIYLLVLDDLHVEPEKTHSVRTSAREFVERHIGPTDVAAIVTTAGFGESAGEFTQDRARLLKIIDSFMGRKDPTEPASSSNLRGAPPGGGGGGGGGGGRQGGGGMPGMMGGAGGAPGMGGMPGMGRSGGGAGGGGGQGGGMAIDPDKRIRDMKDAFDAMKSIDVLRRVAQMMSRVPGRRKAVLFFSQGFGYNVYDVMGKDTLYASDVRNGLADAIAAATRSNVAFYPIDPRGLAIAGFGEDDADSLRRSLESLQALGHDTGGFAAINNNDYKRALVRVVEENSSYYVLGYYPNEPKQDGRFHRITVKVRRPGINVVARPGYTAPDPRREERDKREQAKRARNEQERYVRERAKRHEKNGSVDGRPTIAAAAALAAADATAADTAASASDPVASAPDPVADQLAELLGTPISVTGLAMRMQAAPFKGSGRKASVLVTLQIDGAELPMLDKDGRYRNKIQIALIALDDRGRVAHTLKAVADLAVPNDESIRLRASGVRWVTKFDLEPGRFHLRLAASEAILGKNGSVLCDVDIPDFEREDRSISGLLLTSNAAALAFTQGWEDVNTWDLPAPITASRTFVQNDVLFAALELYEEKRPPRDQALVVQIKAADGAIVQRFSNTFKARDLKKDRFVPYLTLPLETLSPGQYVLQVEAKPANSNDSPLTRALSFEVLPRPRSNRTGSYIPHPRTDHSPTS